MSLPNHMLPITPLCGGIEICNPTVNEVGTLGFLAVDAQGAAGMWLVSCYHVLVGAAARMPVNGESVEQPGGSGVSVATVDATRCDAVLDCAAARLVVGVSGTGAILGIGVMGSAIDPAVGMRVIKSGAATGVTEASVVAVAGDDVTLDVVPGFDPSYAISDYGDSGSLWLERDSRRPVALHLRGIPPTLTQAQGRSIKAVLAKLRLSLA